MKKKIFALGLMLVLALTLGIAACSKKNEEENEPNPRANQTIYTFATTQDNSHSGLAFVTLKTNANGSVSERYLDEAFIPNEWAKLTVADALALGAARDETTTTKIAGNSIIVIAMSQGSLSASATPSFYPKWIEITLGGTAQLYMGKAVTVSNNSGATPYGEATEVATDLTVAANTVEITTTAYAGTIGTKSCVRYYPVASTTADPAAGAKSLEYKLSTDHNFAKSYIETLRSYELAKTSPTDVNTTAIKYLKADGTKIDTVRLAARKAFVAPDAQTATTGKIAIGASMMKDASTDLSGGAHAYATTFFKRGSSYGSNMKVLPIEGGELNLNGAVGTPDKLPEEAGTWEAIDRAFQAFLNTVGVENLTAEQLLKLSKTGNKWEYNFGTTATPRIVTFASSYHTNIYLSLYLKAYAQLAAL